MKLSNKAIVVSKGNSCPKCGELMDRKKHPVHWKPRKSYYYNQWDQCRPCGHIQHYSEFKSEDWKEFERQSNFLRNL